MFIDMILNGEMRRTANHKMTVSVIRRWFCVNISQFSESDQSFSVFSITSTFLTSTSHQRHASLMDMKTITAN